MKYLYTLIIIVAAAVLCFSGCSSMTPDNLGIRDGRFAPCPETDSCVSSQALDGKNKVAPIKAQGGADKVMIDLANSIESMFGAKVVEMDGNYLHAEFKSRLFRLIDDLECYYDEKKGVIEVRSSSRNSAMDFNASRNRIEELREIFARSQ